MRSAVGAALRALGLGGVARRLRAFHASRPARAAAARWRSTVVAQARKPRVLELVAGQVDATSIPVIVCTWMRPDRISAILDNLAAQNPPVRIRLMIWNNRPEFEAIYREEFARRGAPGAIASIEFISSEKNLGGMARFLVARGLVLGGYTGPFITFDDDQNVSATFVSDLLAQHARDTIAGWWAWCHNPEDYWDRRPALPNEQADYIGTAGAVFHTSLVNDRTFFTSIPARFGFLEDMWASHRVASRGGRLRKVDTPGELVQEELNQNHGLIYLKLEFAQWLRENPSR